MDSRTVVLPTAENDMSRRYLQVLMRWVPVALQAFNIWPARPHCGHFFGGVYWYGLETAGPSATLALVASSPEFDPALVGCSALELRQIALQVLRYLCLTHDTGPAECVRPLHSWGRPEPAGTKWGERGQGFFPESQCGVTLAYLALTAALLRDMLGDEERAMLAAITTDYLARFGAMAPRSGVYYDTQCEENGWTALGLVASLLLLAPTPATLLPAALHRWMFCTATMPQDTANAAVFADGTTVREWCARTYTLLPDGTAENHGFVHPGYMAAAVTLSGEALNLLHLYGQPVPPHLFWHCRDCYNVLKRWCDTTGAPHCPQSMDWPYFDYISYSFLHATANLYLQDADTACLERYVLATVERTCAAHSGRTVPAEVVQYCHTFQDPALMHESRAVTLAQSYLAHRLLGPGTFPADPTALAQRLTGVSVYTHGGFLLHRHTRGQTSLSWRNSTMMLPTTGEGVKMIGPQAGSMLARVQVVGQADSTTLVALTIRESPDRVCVVLVQDLAQDSLRRHVLFASLPHGKCVLVERLVARQALTVESIVQGHLSVINDGYFGDHPDQRGQRRLFWDGGVQVCRGYASDTDAADLTIELTPSRWCNIDDRAGLVFRGSGRAVYHNRHCFPVWRAIEDALVLNLHDTPQTCDAGDTVAQMVALWCPEQSHQETASQTFVLYDSPPETVIVEVDEYLCAGNFGETTVALPRPITIPAGQSLPLVWGVTGVATRDLQVTLQLSAREPMLLALP
jgi:hypothetical protein